MKYDSQKHHRQSIRLHGYDYSQTGGYFLTIVTHDHECLFGDIINGEMVLNDFGKIVQQEWLKTPKIRPEIKLDNFIVMPNHVHGIIMIIDNFGGNRTDLGAYGGTSLRNLKPKSIGSIMAGFKSVVTKCINKHRGTPGVPVWQRNYWEHVIRDEYDLNRIREYIINNPLHWDMDNENPDRL